MATKAPKLVDARVDPERGTMLIGEVFSAGFPQLESGEIEYLTAIVGEGVETGAITSGEHLADTIVDHLVSYGAAETEEQANNLCTKLYTILRRKKILDKFKNPNQKKRDALSHACEEKKPVMALYWEDEGWYDSNLDEITGPDEFYVTFREYGNQEAVMFAGIKPLYFAQEVTLLDCAFRIADSIDQQEDLEDKAALDDILFIRGSFKSDTDYFNKKSAKEYGLTQKQKKEFRKQKAINDRLEAFDPEVYFRMYRQKVRKEWFEPLSGTRDVHIPDYNLYALDDKSILFEGQDIKFVEGKHYGLIGSNGCGKTTLLRRISRYDIESFPPQLRVFHCEQEIRGDETKVMQYVLESDVVRTHLLEREAKATARSEAGEPGAAADLTEVYELMEEWDVRGAEQRATAILKGLHFDDRMLEWETKRLSGGWRMRVALACALFIDPDILLLDEPTNHLDFPSVIWLENYLRDYKKTLIIVSHDRDFLNAVVHQTIHFANKQLTYYNGNMDTFDKVRREIHTKQTREYKAQESKVAEIQRFIDKNKANASKAKLVQSRVKELKRMVMIPEPLRERQLAFKFPNIEPFDGAVVTTDDIVFGYAADRILVKKVSVQVECGSRVGIVGANGAGKSTLLALMIGQLLPLHGNVFINRQIRISIFAQHHVDQLDLGKSAMDFFMIKFKDSLEGEKRPAEVIRRNLGAFGISGGLVTNRMANLSGGQKSRVAFAAIAWKRPQFIIMDEPTNHLDSETIEALITALKGYQGGVLIVSHDQYFLQQVVTSYWALAEGVIHHFEKFKKAKEFCVNL